MLFGKLLVDSFADVHRPTRASRISSVIADFEDFFILQSKQKILVSLEELMLLASMQEELNAKGCLLEERNARLIASRLIVLLFAQINIWLNLAFKIILHKCHQRRLIKYEHNLHY